MAEPTFRSVGPDESLDGLFDLADLAFHASTSPARRARYGERMDRGETVCAYDGDRMVGTSIVWLAPLSVPGGQLPCGAVSWVSVAPTYRRRGLLRGMMETQLDRLIQGGTPLAALWASEATIYGRFGFAVATRAHSYDIHVRDRDSGISATHEDGPPAALIDPTTAREVLRDVYDRAARRWAGVLGRDEDWWTNGVLVDPEDDRHGNQLRVVTAGEPADGYALYRTSTDDTVTRGPQGVIEVEELVATTREAAHALWAYLLSIDLVGRVRARLRPTDDPLDLMLRNPRTAQRTETDALWIRLLDLPRALRAREWSAPLELVLDVEDELVPANAGRWLLSAAAGRAECVRTDRPADLALTVGQLGAIYLGGGSLVRAVDAGLVDEPTPGAAALLDQAARTARAPWNVSVF